MENLVVNINSRNLEILDPGMDPIEKIGRMARLCYKVEPKEGEDSASINNRIIANCIKEGHESVLDHGSYSVFIPMEPGVDGEAIIEKLAGVKGHKTSFRQVWERRPTDAQQRYLLNFNDPDIDIEHRVRRGHQVLPQNKVILPVVLGDARALRLVIREKMFSSVNISDDPLEFAVTVKVLQALNDVAPILFSDIVNEVNSFLGHEVDSGSKARVDKFIRLKLTEETRDIDGVCSMLFSEKDCIYAEKASPSASVSYILTTDRATTHQLVRHRKDVGYSQESQRYVNYNKKGYCAMALTVDPDRVKGSGIEVDPVTGEVKENSEVYKIWKEAIDSAFASYQKLVEAGLPPESARGVLPNDAQTKIGVTWLMPNGICNYIFWRLDKHAQFSIRKSTADLIVTSLQMKHPWLTIVNPDMIIGWIRQIRDQKLVSDLSILDTFEEAMETRKKEIAAYQAELIAKQQEAMKRAEEEARKLGEENAVNQEEPRVVKVSDETTQTSPTESVAESAPTVKFEK